MTVEETKTELERLCTALFLELHSEVAEDVRKRLRVLHKATIEAEREGCVVVLNRLIEEAKERAAPHDSGAGARRATRGGLEMALDAIRGRMTDG